MGVGYECFQNVTGKLNEGDSRKGEHNRMNP